MSVDARLQSLKNKHSELEANLQAEEARPHPDESRIHRLKREKLQVKDEIQRLSERVAVAI